MDPSKLSIDQLELADKIAESAIKYGLNPDFVLPMVMQESGFDHSKESKKGALGGYANNPRYGKNLWLR